MTSQSSQAERAESASVSAVVVLAAGGGTRMKSSTSKLLHQVGGRSMLSYALEAASALDPEHLVVVVGHLREQVLDHLHDIAPHVKTAVQDEQRGTGHAVQCGLAVLGDVAGEVVVTYGDVPMLDGETLLGLVADHRTHGNHITVLTAMVDDPTGYGRVLRDGDEVVGIVEQRDATDDERQIREINSGIYVFDAATLGHGLANLRTDNAQGELYLTDVIGIARERGERVGAFVCEDAWQTEGINDRVQLAAMNREINRRIVERLMRDGVTVLDPDTTWVHDSVDVARDVTLLPGTQLEGATSVAGGATIGPDTTLRDCEVGEGATVVRSHCQLSVIGDRAVVGPYAVLRPGTEIGADAHVGSFVETLAANVQPGASVPRLTFLGDAGSSGSASGPR